ncbi:MAG: hypothetical protein JWQ90_1895 [Hydrocarboniphaga sp.]|uniref:type I-E CRISPR-associated protein Cse2/CasB n=1 Tax=Hydrocarboniphaga sp. TaxID=2033016 RepID=UPI002636FA49|nr:type I-E CRISPR-associated protein Cse2/CasB [Hydrocarboniphaga sp.]MDB5969445.1 hypothetical protein [Hydrocarboniphaga sp.]
MNHLPRHPFRADDPLGRVVLRYRDWLHDRERSHARAARARLRRCAGELDAVSERGAHELLRSAEAAYTDRDDEPPHHDRLLALAPLLAWVETHGGERSLPAQLAQSKEGADRPRLSELRFQRLLAAQGAELHQELRRALQLLDKTANALWLAEAVCDWDNELFGTALRRRWAYQYYSHLPKSA